MWTFRDYPELRRRFFECFRTGVSEFYDPLPSLMSGVIVIDIVAFDKWLHKTVGDYEADGMSLCEAVTEYFGDEAAMLIDDLTLYFIRPDGGGEKGDGEDPGLWG